MRINESVIKLEKMSGANAYIYITPDGTVSLVDTGMPGNLKTLLREFDRYGIPGDTISFIILTHGDIDHAGSAVEIAEATGARIAAHFLERPYITGDRRKIHHGVIPSLLSSMSGLIPARRADPDIDLKDGECIGGLEVIHCPGHTDGSISLYVPGRLLFSGDAICTDRRGRLKGFSARFTEDSCRAALSMRRISALDYGMLLPGHGTHIGEGASSIVNEFLGVRCGM